MKGDLYCLDGRLMRHDPQFDDPDLITDVGECEYCSGDGCGDQYEMMSKAGRYYYGQRSRRAAAIQEG